jgi:thiamine transport system permease protein
MSGVGEVLGDPSLRQVAWFTLWQAAGSTALTLVLALPAAHVLARYDFRGRRLVQALVTVPSSCPPWWWGPPSWPCSAPVVRWG